MHPASAGTGVQDTFHITMLGSDVTICDLLTSVQTYSPAQPQTYSPCRVMGGRGGGQKQTMF